MRTSVTRCVGQQLGSSGMSRRAQPSNLVPPAAAKLPDLQAFRLSGANGSRTRDLLLAKRHGECATGPRILSVYRGLRSASRRSDAAGLGAIRPSWAADWGCCPFGRAALSRLAVLARAALATPRAKRPRPVMQQTQLPELIARCTPPCTGVCSAVPTATLAPMIRQLAALSAVLALLGLSAAAATGGTGRETQLVTIHPEGRASARGIGLVRLEEPQARVTEQLGPGHLVSRGTELGEPVAEYKYRSGSITIEVGYGNGLVTGVSTTSSKAVLFGRPLSDGVRTFTKILHGRRGWRVDHCRHRTFTALAPGGPGTGIEWKSGQVKLVMIDVGGVLDACATL